MDSYVGTRSVGTVCKTAGLLAGLYLTEPAKWLLLISQACQSEIVFNNWQKIVPPSNLLHCFSSSQVILAGTLTGVQGLLRNLTENQDLIRRFIRSTSSLIKLSNWKRLYFAELLSDGSLINKKLIVYKTKRVYFLYQSGGFQSNVTVD